MDVTIKNKPSARYIPEPRDLFLWGNDGIVYLCLKGDDGGHHAAVLQTGRFIYRPNFGDGILTKLVPVDPVVLRPC